MSLKPILKIWFIILGCVANINPSSAARNELLTTADCVCVGEISTYECSVVGGMYTVWKGSILPSDCEVTLIHDEYLLPNGARGECNNGDVVGKSIGVVDNCYTSRLNVSVSETLEGRTVECNVDNGSTILIGVTRINITTEPFPPPSNVELTNVVPGEVTFSWTLPPQTCPSLRFNVFADNCGTCQNNTLSSSTTCRNFTLPNQCTLEVQSVICGILVSSTIAVTANLKFPEAPIILKSIPKYSDSDGRLLRINSTFRTVDSFEISGRMNGSASSYIIFYADSVSGAICDSAIIEAQSCKNGVCNHLFDSSSSNCPPSSDISISVLATNVLGNGTTSSPLLQSGVNNFVDIKFNSQQRTISCDFINQPPGFIKNCSVNITYGDDCDNQLDVYSNEGTGDSITTRQLMLVTGQGEYCFTATAMSGNETVIVEGTLNLFEINIGAATASTVVIVIIIMFAVFTATTVMIFLRWKFQKSLIMIKFSNPDERGSLADMLKVFKNNHVNIIRINTAFTADDIKRKYFSKRKIVENYVYISCTFAIKEELKQLSNFEIIEDSALMENSEESHIYIVKFSVQDKPGTLWKVMDMLANKGIDIRGLNTQSNYGKEPNYKDNYVSCWCTNSQRQQVRKGLVDAGAININIGDGDGITVSSTRTLQFYVKHEPGALAEALEAFRALDINLFGTNPAYITLPCHDIPGREIVYVECICNEENRELLLEKLKESGERDAEQHEPEQEKSYSYGAESKSRHVIKITINDQVGSLVSALEVFKLMNINIIGVNTFQVDKDVKLHPSKKTEYKHIEIEYTTESGLNVDEFIIKLKASGRITEVEYKPPAQGQQNHVIEFLARHKVGTLAKALEVFIEHDLNIVSLHQKSLSRDVVYVHNHVRFIATNQQEVDVISKLYATGLVIDVSTFKWDDVHVTRMKDAHIQLQVGETTDTAIYAV